jgi:beta-barrel assembly-enhancing protease
MRTKLFLDFLKLIAIFGAIWAAFVFIPWFPKTADLKYPVEQEVALGELIMENLIEKDPQFQKLNNPTVDSAVAVISKRLLENLELTDYDYNIIVVNNEMVNAFALPGGNIVILSGLISFSESPEEVAAVLAHEIGHVEKRHVMKRLIKEFGLQLLFGVLTGGDGIILSEVSKTATSTYFDRKQEEEADDFSLELLQRSQLETKALGTIFRRMKHEHNQDSEFDYFTTHPHMNSRIKKAFEYPVEDGFKVNSLDLDWESVKNSIKSNTNQAADSTNTKPGI